jgi:hypothetical protein
MDGINSFFECPKINIQMKKGKTAIAATKIQTVIKTNILNQQQTPPHILGSSFFILTLTVSLPIYRQPACTHIGRTKKIVSRASFALNN